MAAHAGAAGPGALAVARAEARMLPLSTLRFLLVVPLLLVAAAFLGISASIILRGRPLLIRGRLLSWALLVIWAPLALAMLIIAYSVSDVSVACIAVLQIGVAALIILAARRAMRGYLIIGISENMFRESLQSALSRLGLPFQESVIGFTLPSLHETLRTSLAPRLGSAQFQMESPDHPEVLAQIAKRVEEHLRADPEPPSMVAPLIYGVAGLIVLALAAYQAGRF